MNHRIDLKILVCGPLAWLALALAACSGDDSSAASGASGSDNANQGGSAIVTGSGGSRTGTGGSSSSGGGAGTSETTSSGGASGSAGSSGAQPTSDASSDARSGAGGSVVVSDASAKESGASCPSIDPLKTGNAGHDAFDCILIDLAAKYQHPDPMMLKAQVNQESDFNEFAVSMDSPCGIHAGWTDAESKSFGLIQTTPACGEAKVALLPDGHPNLTKDMASALWANSVFNPAINLDQGAMTTSESMKALKAKYTGCTENEYTLMAAGAFNSGNNAITGCGQYNARAQAYVTAVLGRYQNLAKAANYPYRY
jgi:hypothetical protein